MITIDDPCARLLERLEGVKPSGRDKWLARCPGHDDRHASLTVARGDNGAALVKCHAGGGCSLESIVAAIGLSVKELFPPREHRNHHQNGSGHRAAKKPAKTYATWEQAIEAGEWVTKGKHGGEWVYEDAEVVEYARVVRFDLPEGKVFRPFRVVDGGWQMGDPVKWYPYRLPQLLSAIEDDLQTVIVICEGEKAADAAAALGLIATTSAHGAKSPGSTDWSALSGQRSVIVPDADEAGEGYAEKVLAIQSELRPPAETRIVRLPNLPEHGDFVEYVRAGGTGEHFMRLMDTAPRSTPGQNDQSSDNASAGSRSSLLATARQNTDCGNSARFVLRYGADLRYCHQRGAWLIWNRKRWEWDERGQVVSLAKKTAMSIFSEAAAEEDDARRASLAKWAVASQKRERITAMIALAQPELAITVDELDADQSILNCDNGTVRLKTGEVYSHRREDLLTKICRIAYRPEATAPTFDRFTRRIFQTHPNLIDFVQRAIGYGATGMNTEQVLFFLYGKGSNGKTTLLDAVMDVLGDYAAKADPELLMAHDGSAAHPCNVADLMGRRLVVCSETNDTKRFDESKLKDLVGETRLKARFMRQDFFSFTATHKIFLYSNHKPVVRGTDFGFWRRMRLIPFVETITDDEKDRNLLDKLKAEGEGILAWIVAGAVRWYRDGLGTPAEVIQATSAYRTDMDSIGAFITECCIEAESLKSYAADLYTAYVRWREENGEDLLSQKRFGTSLSERGFVSGRCGYSDRKMWGGIGLKTAMGRQN